MVSLGSIIKVGRKSMTICKSIALLCFMVFAPSSLFAGVAIKITCPDGSTYLSNSGIPEELIDKGCRISQGVTEPEHSALDDKKRDCKLRCEELRDKAKELENDAKKEKDSVYVEEAQRFRRYALFECEADCIDGINPRDRFIKKSKEEQKQKENPPKK